jgi:hypothetical protein
MRKLLRRLAPLGLVLLPACSPATLLNATVSAPGIQVQRDIAYGDDPRQKLDVWQPAGAHHAPMVVFLYGGSWDSGSRSDYRFVAAPLAEAGAVTIVPDYRLYPQVRFPDFLADCARAVAWSLAHAAEYGGPATDRSAGRGRTGLWHPAFALGDDAFSNLPRPGCTGTGRTRCPPACGAARPAQLRSAARAACDERLQQCGGQTPLRVCQGYS